jgi:hypothetical protein
MITNVMHRLNALANSFTKIHKSQTVNEIINGYYYFIYLYKIKKKSLTYQKNKCDRDEIQKQQKNKSYVR